MTGNFARRSLAACFAPFPFTVALAIAMNAVLLASGVPAPAQDAIRLAALVLTGILGALIAHDLAHLLAAWVLGFRTVVATLGLFVFAPTRRGLRVRAVRTWGEIAAGLVAEPRAERRMNGRWALVALAGPAASLALGVLTLDSYPALAIASLARFALAAFPFGAPGVPTDGSRLLLLLAGGARADRYCAMQRITAAQHDGIRPRTWPERWITDATTLHDGSAAEAMACAAGFRRALDGCAHDRASAFLDRALALRATLPRAAACSLLADAAYFEARIHDDATRARAWLDEAARRRPACPVAERRAAAAVSIASGDFAAGAEIARQGLAYLERLERDEQRRMPMEADWLNEMLARAECAIVLPDELLAFAS